MTVAAAVFATLTVVLLVAAGAGWVVFRRRELERGADVQLAAAARDRLLDGLYVERVVVTLRSGESFGGLLADIDPHSILLRSAEGFVDGKSVPVDGELLVPRADLLYIQKP